MQKYILNRYYYKHLNRKENTKNKLNRVASETSVSGMTYITNLTDVIFAEALNRSIFEKVL